jgi:hypothetical protein
MKQCFDFYPVGGNLSRVLLSGIGRRAGTKAADTGHGISAFTPCAADSHVALIRAEKFSIAPRLYGKAVALRVTAYYINNLPITSKHEDRHVFLSFQKNFRQPE